jgi:hypothetical protein
MKITLHFPNLGKKSNYDTITEWMEELIKDKSNKSYPSTPLKYVTKMEIDYEGAPE